MSLPTDLLPLCREFDRERPNVLVVVGAGVSYGATGEARASWRGLLEHGVETLRSSGAWNDDTANANLTLVRNAFSSVFDLDDVLGSAERVAKALGAPNGEDYGAWLHYAIGSLEARGGRTATLDAIKHLEQAGALILTTNYDDLLSNVTGLEPVTWQDHREFLRVLNRDREGVLHIHGHWRTPSSVILGRRSYEQIVATAELQDLFKSIWMHWSWLYVGCGNGLEDPNVGRLLRWGQVVFGESGRKHFFLAQEGAAADLSARTDKPANLIPVGYPDHSDLPGCLEKLTPRRRPAPFVELGPTGGPVRLPFTSPLDIPLPSWQELLDGDMPSLAVDTTVTAALNNHGFALVYDVASVGKTTLALRLAAASQNRGSPAFYLDIARLATVDEDESARIRAAVRRLANAKALVILDNAHWAPQLALELWDWWRDRPRASRLLISATRVQHTAGVSGDDALEVIARRLDNPAIAVQVLPEDLGPVLNSIVKRVSGRDTALRPPASVLAAWHATFANEMGAFAAAITDLCHQLLLGQWTLPLAAASEWIRNRHLNKLDAEGRENAVCLAVFAEQELVVTELALPHPDKVVALLRGGLAERHEFGRERNRFYSLREPDWGPLLLAAMDPRPDVNQVLLEAARRNADIALSLSGRYLKLNESARLQTIWRNLLSTGAVTQIAGQLLELPLDRCVAVFFHAVNNAKPRLVDDLWEALEKDPVRLANQAFMTQLAHVGSFIVTASAHNRSTLVNILWDTLEKDPVGLANLAFGTQLGHVRSFIVTASAHNKSTLVDGLWDALEKDPVRLANQAFGNNLSQLGSFIDTALALKRSTLVDGLWEAFEKDPVRLANQAFGTQLGHVRSFIVTASAHKRSTLVDVLWDSLEKDPVRLANQAFGTPLEQLGSFIDTASAHKRSTLVDGLWEALEQDPVRLANQAFGTPLEQLGSFIDTASAHNKSTLVDGLWDALEKDPVRLANQAFGNNLSQLGSFIDTASAHKRSTLVDGLWEALEQDPVRLQAAAASQSGANLLGFLKRAPRASGRLAIAKLDVVDWTSGKRVLKGFWGAPRLASQFSKFGRDDLAAALRGLLLRTSDRSWFSAPYAALLDVAILLSTLSKSEQPLVESFVDRICSRRWLEKQYLGKTKEGALSGALLLLALSQPPPIIRRFWAPSLRERIATSIARLGAAEGEILSELIQFLGTTELIGQSLPRAPFAAARLDRIVRLPSDVLPHRPDVAGIESKQLTLWLGLRVAARLAIARLQVSRTEIDETLQRWSLNMNPCLEPGRASCELANSMCKWLEACSLDGRGILLPSREPLWLVVGFGRDPVIE